MSRQPLVIGVAAALAAACAQPPVRTAAHEVKRPPLGVSRLTQVGFGRDAAFALCAQPACPTRTPKTLVSSAPSIRPVALPVTPPEPPQPKEHVERLTVSFAVAGSSLSAQEKKRIRDFLPVARQAARIVISGRTDSTGEEQANDRLALSRAIATRNFLRQQIPGVDNVIVIDAKGSCCFVADNATPQGRARNRRVDVAFALQG